MNLFCLVCVSFSNYLFPSFNCMLSSILLDISPFLFTWVSFSYFHFVFAFLNVLQIPWDFILPGCSHPEMVGLTVLCACDHLSLGEDCFSFLILTTFPWMQTTVSLFLFHFRKGERQDWFWKRARDNRYCLCFFTYTASPPMMNIPMVPRSFSHFPCGLHWLVNLPLLWHWEKRYLTDGQRRKKDKPWWD